VTAYVISTSIHSAEKMVLVYTAAQTIPDDTVITASEMTGVNISASVVPTGVIQSPQAVIGKYADATIAQGEPILQSDVAPATTVRQLVRTYGMNFVGATVQIDPSDLPITDVQPGDLVDLVGVYGTTQNQNVYTQWIAQGVPVIAIDTTNTKVVLAVPQVDALSLVRDLTIGKVRVLLDPQPFKGIVSFATKQSATATLPKIKQKGGTIQKNSNTGANSALASSGTLPLGKPVLANAKQIKTVQSSHLSPSH
jgi:Flp pilus assembly protein CpaB